MALTYPPDGAVTLRANLVRSPPWEALVSGAVTSPGITFDFGGTGVAFDGFRPMLDEGRYDIGEFAIAPVLQSQIFARPIVPLPVVMTARAQHGFLFCRAADRTLAPKDLEGRCVAVRSYSQSTGFWIRAILQHQFGVDLDRVTWLAGEGPHVAESHDPSNVKLARADLGDPLRMLLAGHVDAAILGSRPSDATEIRSVIPHLPGSASRIPGHPILPFNHLFVVRRELAEQRPDIVREIYGLLASSRSAAGRGDLAALPFGFEAVGKAVARACEYALEQKLIPHSLNAGQVFREAKKILEP